ncbi:exodeoxyribonuclease VII large subunit [Ureibacillus terrenus]|uniref:Exodeoxyribonuclease 7 large subunit n=2 Tax=Ureibacillus terrenus TaxID=118246 RepID=A0A540V666_9BACL|nr:exodeoxyribonuclease VII large subunit [Ureibacillus terrenus]MED3660770.1 exodeoxyribonuclease VII large subunit [Ureibacillus terrenus]MED3762958.1 exodeoxyribonuclease VII large subunit [Ureibacillus terrenus]TQE92242.1 exodeoxyribonuclease VII large subunit [Ureibacillus terrenus]
MMPSSYLTVKALTKYIKRKFDADPHLRDVYVKGELSNVKIHPSGHIYFTLKDDSARINALMFRSQASQLKFKPEDGMQVLIRGDVNVYEAQGSYQLYVLTMEPDGIGSLFIAFNQLKEKLYKEGLFDPNYKKPIPKFPRVIGVCTATSGAAIRDICTTIKRRYPLAEIIIYPTLVQGIGAAESIVKNIRLANKHGYADVLIVGRGGGSIEDLWAFNEEMVARAIFESRIPIISAVGHETDTTIADYVADLRAPTPTAAAELAVPNIQELYQRILTCQSQMHHIVRNRLIYERNRLNKLQQSYPLSKPDRLFRPFAERLIQADLVLRRAGQMYLMKKKNELSQMEGALKLYSSQNSIVYYKKQIEHLSGMLTRAVFQSLNRKKEQYLFTIRTLQALNPLSIMERGFSVTYKDGRVVKSISQLKKDDDVSIQFHDGMVKAKVTEIRKEAGENDD